MDLQEWQRSGRAYRHRGHDIFFRRGGGGEALLLIHGFPTSSWDWHRLWGRLIERFDVIAPDMIGFGFSAKPVHYDYSIMDQASLHEALLSELQISRVHVVAHDYGDTVAQELLARQSDRVRSVCLLNGGIFPGVHRPLRIQKLLAGPFGFLLVRLLSQGALRRSFRRIFGAGTQPTDREIQDFWTVITHNHGRRVLHKLIRYMKERDTHGRRWVEALDRTPVALRHINGLSDPISGAHVAEYYRHRIEGADVVGLDGIGHYPQVEAPDAVASALLDFIPPG